MYFKNYTHFDTQVQYIHSSPGPVQVPTYKPKPWYITYTQVQNQAEVLHTSLLPSTVPTHIFLHKYRAYIQIQHQYKFPHTGQASVLVLHKNPLQIYNLGYLRNYMSNSSDSAYSKSSRHQKVIIHVPHKSIGPFS